MGSNYELGRIYKIVNDVDDEFYIGSTCQFIDQRLAGHRREARKPNPRLVHRHLNAVGWEHVHIELVELYPCDSKRELEERERFHIEMAPLSLNKNIPTRSAICCHNRRRIQCKECGGTAICCHGRYHQYCKECIGPSICSHNRQRRYCVECGGASLCTHKRQRGQCVQCNPSLNDIVECACGSRYKAKSKYSHAKGKKHLRIIAEQLAQIVTSLEMTMIESPEE